MKVTVGSKLRVRERPTSIARSPARVHCGSAETLVGPLRANRLPRAKGRWLKGCSIRFQPALEEWQATLVSGPATKHTKSPASSGLFASWAVADGRFEPRQVPARRAWPPHGGTEKSDPVPGPNIKKARLVRAFSLSTDAASRTASLTSPTAGRIQPNPLGAHHLLAAVLSRNFNEVALPSALSTT